MISKEDILEMKSSMNVASLIESLKDPNPLIRVEAIKALSELHLGDVAALLGVVINDPDPRVQRAIQDVSMGLPVRDEGNVRLGGDIRADDRSFQQSKSKKAEIHSERVTDEQLKFRWFWILLKTWGVTSVLFAFLILIFAFSQGSFGDSDQVISVLIFASLGVIMLVIAAKKLRSNKESEL